MRQNKKIGLALGAGASRGFAHIGVLQVLEENDIKPDYIAGSSIGAIIGALYAAGITPKMLEGLACNIDEKLCYDVGFNRRGVIQGKKVEELIALLTQNKDFKELNIPFAATAVDLVKSERVILTEGKVYKAVRASISIPGVFQPVNYGDKVLVDGGLLERLPVNVVREMGADIVIGIDVAFKGEHNRPNNFIETILQSFEVLQIEIMRHNVLNDDILISPEVDLPNPLSFDNMEEIIEAGRIATKEVVDEMKMLTIA